MTQALGMAPGLASLVMYIGSTRHGDHQRDDDAQSVADDDWLLVGMDAGGSEHAGSVLPEDGGAGTELLCGFGRQLHLVVDAMRRGRRTMLTWCRSAART